MSRWTVVGALGAALAVIGGAFGAHLLEARLQPEAIRLWETASRYLMYGSLALLVLGVAGDRTATRGAGWSLTAGTAIFSSTVAALALGGPRWLGAVTPIGGVLMIAGFALFAWSAARG
jgi:uncharacterized membrane protein YgdD (TMEM256/DUF423 family)